MNRTLKPLFRPEVLRDRLKGFVLPPEAGVFREKLAKLQQATAGRDRAKLNEENLRPGFLSDVFGAILGYTTPNQSPEAFTMVPEFAIPGGRGFVDAALGRAPRHGRDVVLAVEIKGPTDPLDIPHAGRRLSAVEQGFDYAINLSCDWIVVTSMVETRLYYKGSDRFTCERFLLEQLATNDDTLRRFIYVLGATRCVPEFGRSHLYALLEESRIAGENITRTFYAEYSRIRLDAFNAIAAKNPQIPKLQVLSHTQKILDRILFCAFAEDRGLLPSASIKNAYSYIDPYYPRPRWDNFKGLFRSIDVGNSALQIARYNGGLFAPDAALDALLVPDEISALFKRLADFDFRAIDETDYADEALQKAASVVDVEILGHIFEQSITDLERFRLELEGKVEAPTTNQAKSKRKKEGAFYTPKFITRYIVEHTLGPVLRARLEELRLRHLSTAKGTGKKVLENPLSYDISELKAPQRDALVAFWSDWQGVLGRIRVVDPACGSGAFLIEAFDQLHAAYQEANSRLEVLRGAPEIFDLNRQILQKNLYGVDLNDEAVEICRLSLWIKTAEQGKILTDLDHSIRVGNTIMDDPAVHPRALDWQAAFPEVFAEGGFDVVIGNPPYIRQEWLSPYKDFLKGRYKSFSGTADLYIYFIERGMELLKSGGHLGMITSGTFAKGNFASDYRKWLPTAARFTSLVNFGENQPFEDAEMVYPTISTFQKMTGQEPFPTLFLNEGIPASLSEAMEEEGLLCDITVFNGAEWKFQPSEVTNLYNRIMNTGTPLGELCEGRMYRGILTGFNEAFIIDTPTKEALVRKDPKSAEILRPILKGEDLRPWYQDWEGRWLLSIPSGFTKSKLGKKTEEDEAFSWFKGAYPAIAAHLEPFEEVGQARSDQGDYWWELRACSYYQEFDSAKIVWSDISKLPRFSMDQDSMYLGNTGYIAIVPGMWVLSILQSRVFWFLITQTAQSLRLRGGLWQYRCIDTPLRQLRIETPGKVEQKTLATLADSITNLAKNRHQLHGEVRHRILADLLPKDGKLNNALTQWWNLDFKDMRAEIVKLTKEDIHLRERGQWESAMADWRGAHQRMTAEIIALETEMNERVYRLYGMSDADVAMLEGFMKRTKTLYPYGET